MIATAPAVDGRARRASLDVARDALCASRPLFWLNTAAPCAVAAALAPPGTEARSLTAIAFATLPLNLFVYALNDLYDVETDRANARKGSVEGARLEPVRLRRLVGLALAALAPFVACFLATAGAAANAALLVLLGASVAYSAPPLRLKGVPVLDSLSNAAYALPFVFACLFLEVPEPPWREAAAFAAWAVGSHALTAIQDATLDRAAGIRTIATALGARGAALFALVVYLGCAGLLAGRGAYAALGIGYALLAAVAARPRWPVGRGEAELPHAVYRVFIALNLATGFVVTTHVALAHPAKTAFVAACMIGLCLLVGAALGATRRAGSRG